MSTCYSLSLFPHLTVREAFIVLTLPSHSSRSSHCTDSPIPVSQFEKPSFVLNRRLQDELSHMDIQLSVVNHTGELLFTPHAARVRDFFLLMACCNTVVVAKHPHKDKVSCGG